MAPITRSSVHGRKPSQGLDSVGTVIARINFQCTLTLLEQEQPDLDQHSYADSDREMASSSDVDDMAEDGHPIDVLDESPQTSAQELLRPLQETADRVSRQMEQFAQALDQFHSQRSKSSDDVWDNTFVLMERYAEIAEKRAAYIESQRTGARTSQKNRKSLGDTAAQKNDLELESRLWSLSSDLLPYRNKGTIEKFEYSQSTGLVELHQYSTNSEIWSAMLEVDPIADQYETMLSWLQQWKQKNSPELRDDALASWARTDRGDGPSTMGNIFTKGTIKQLKRKRVHTGALDSKNPDIRAQLRRDSDGAILATEMDPDAPSRHSALLELQDELYETSAWHTCWEMLRRGRSLEDCRDWWQERNELWRYLVTQTPTDTSDPKANQPLHRIAGLASNRLHAELCKEFGKQQVADNDYENAVYGILGGSYAAAAPACETIDDHLYCLINEMLIERYEQFLKAYDHKVLHPESVVFVPQHSKMQEISKYFKAAQTEKSTRDEAHQPLKYLQCAIMSGDVVPFLQNLGHAAAQMAFSTGESTALFEKDQAEVGECAQVAARNEDCVRIVVHLQLALQDLGLLESAYKVDAVALENNIINYIGLLERHAKYLLLPLYASKLDIDKQPKILGRVLSKVTNSKERDIQMRLMKQYNIPANKVIYTICDYARGLWSRSIVEDAPAKIVEYKKKIVCVKTDFIGEVNDEEDREIVETHEWVSYIDKKNWGMAVWLVTTLYKALLLSGKIAAAKYLSAKVGLTTTSLKATGMNLSIAASVYGAVTPERDTSMMSDGEEDESPRISSPTKKRKDAKDAMTHPLAKQSTSRTDLANQSLTWAHLEHLVVAMDMLEEWQTLANEVDKAHTDSRVMKPAKSRLQAHLQTVHQAMQPLFATDFLNTPNDQEESEVLTIIRNHYLPECVLAYNSVLYFAGHALSRQNLVQCMELAQIVAQNPTLTNVFVASKRMKELVTTFALDSQALLRANESGAGNARQGAKRSAAGKKVRADIWQVSWKD